MSFLNVKVYHGPSTSFHCLEHKPQKLHGLKDRLQKLGYRVDLVEVPYFNYCVLEMCDQEVFRCNLNNLMFNTHYARDVVAQRAVNAVLYASAKLQVARNHLWFGALVDEEMFTRGPHTPIDYWPKDVEVKPYVSCNKCVACCDIVVKREGLAAATASRCYEFHISLSSLHIV